ncbi:MAG TPA: hypothetical protein EYH03_04805 [Chromatiales bacterium]|nr:hypothetical protein [Chromatiales bacterium]
MMYPDFFDDVEPIRLKDELAEFLGTFAEGIVDIGYLDVVKAAGHSCPTVVGAYLMTREGLGALYPGELPVRGEIKVEFKESVEEGTAGVVGNVVSNITGATTNTGFKGLNGRFNRTGLMFYDVDIASNMRLSRTDTGASVDIWYTPTVVVQPGPLLQEVMQPGVSEDTKTAFARRWQELVETLFENVDKVVRVAAGSY